MNPRRLLQTAFLTAIAAVPGSVLAQCVNQNQYPSIPTTPDPGGALTTISTCSFQTEYSRVTNIVAGATYQFTIDDGSYITVHQGSNTGPVLGAGNTPVTVVAVTSEDLFPTWNTNANCGTATNCRVTTVQLFLNCTPPVATFSTTNDCANGVFYVNVNISSIGDASALDINYNLDNGATSVIPSVGAGVYQLGPFPLQGQVDVVLEHDSDPACNLTQLNITNLPCPFISCGPDNYTFCYSNNQTYIRIYQGNGSFPLRLQFNAGQIYQFGGDLLSIYDGLSDQAPLLYSGIGNAGNLAGLFFTSTNVDNALTLKLTSDGFTSCADGGVPNATWDYTVGCLDCTPSAGAAGNVVTNCATQSFTVDVNVTDLGSDPQLEIGNTAGVPPTIVTAPGTYTAGPFPVGNPVELTLVNDANALCNFSLGSFENSFCPIQIQCGQPAFEESYCYVNSDNQFWLYENQGTESLALLFTQGTIESSTWDDLRIYDGPNNSSPLLFEHTAFNTFDLSGLLVISTGPAIYMEMTSDGSVSCSSGSQTEWQWTVGCLDCTQPDLDFDVVLDCANNQFFVETTVNALGTDPTIQLTNDGGAPAVDVAATGTFSSGPFAFGQVVRITAASDDNSLCNIKSGFLTNAPCPLVSCGPSTYEYCYPNSADTAVVYQSANSFPIAMIFNEGQLDTFGDSVYVHDGPDYQSPLLFSGFNNTGDMTGLLFTSTNPDNALLMRIRSNFFTSCQDNLFTPLNWSVSCLDCTNPGVTFEMAPDCIHNGFNIAVNVTELGVGATALRIANSLDTDTLNNVGLGTTIVGPFPVDSLVSLTVLSAQNPLCRRVSEVFTYPSDSCIITACAATATDYCYGNADTAWFVYTSGNANPITVDFEYGQLLVNDYIQIFNGPDTSAQMVYMGNQGGNLAGLTVTSNNPDNALTILLISSQTGSCQSGQAGWSYWTVGCGLVGMDERDASAISLYPNPTTGELFINGLPGAVQVEVMDVTGRLVQRERFTSNGATQRMDLGALQSGQYAIIFRGDGWVETRQLQVMH